MAEVINMPRLSDTMEEGTLAKWFKKIGDSVNEGDILAEIETDKATMEVEAVEEGKIKELLCSAGEKNIPVNSPIAILTSEIKENDKKTIKENEVLEKVES